VLLSRPAIEALVDLGLDVTVVAGPWGTPSLQGLPVRVIAFPFPGFTRVARGGLLAPYAALLAFAAHLSRERYDAALVLRPDHWWGALAAGLAGIPIRVGQAQSDTHPFLTHSLPFEAAEHSTAAALRIARALAGALDLELEAIDRPLRFEPSSAGQQAADAWLAAHVGEARRFVALHPGAGAEVKTWPVSRWASIARAMAAEAAVVLTGGPAEAGVLDAIRAAVPAPLPVATDLTWDEVAALYQRAAVVVGMDSGPLHLASAVGSRTVRVYGPTDPRIYGPVDSSPACVLQGTLRCVPCGNLVSPPCGYLQDPPCLASVDAKEVVAAVKSMLPVAASA